MQLLTPGRLMDLGYMILKYVECYVGGFLYIFTKTDILTSMNQERDLSVEGDSIQLGMVPTPSVQ